ncbi:Gaa1-domain-containing protein [Atractiella rhizophila]|nr:Gaa1-domain-containing protein [Atractiella rhizophila]
MASDDKKANQKSLKRIKRNHIIGYYLHLLLSYAPYPLLLAGYLSLMLLPFLPNFHSKHYISENALQVGSATVRWDWPDVKRADRYADGVDQWEHLDHYSRARAIEKEFKEVGLLTSVQSYTYTFPTGQMLNGTNVHALLRAPKTDGSEALVLSASWLSRQRTGLGAGVNRRGIATVLAMSKYFSKYAYWSKDILFVISDGYTEGANAWLAAYHHSLPSNLISTHLSATTGPIWLALALDYPYHSFSHFSMYYEGLDAHVPNLDTLNVVTKVATNVINVPITLHGTPGEGIQSQNWKEEDISSLLANRLGLGKSWMWAKSGEVALRHAAKQIGYQAAGRASGPEGVYGRYAIDSVALFGVPAEGPHGFHTLGRATESVFRSFNNLLERLHHSQTLYLMLGARRFLNVSYYLFSTVILGAACIFRAGGMWIAFVNSANNPVDGKTKELKGEKSVEEKAKVLRHALDNKKEVYEALAVVGATFGAGGIWYITVLIFAEPLRFLNLMLIISPGLALYTLRGPPRLDVNSSDTSKRVIPPSARILSIFQLLTLGLSICILSINNYGLSVILSLTLIPLALFVSPSPQQREWTEKAALTRLLGSWFVAAVTMCIVVLRGTPEVERLLYEFFTMGTRTVPLFAAVVVPQLLLSLGIGCAVEGGMVLV